MSASLARLFEPRSVAIVGASANPIKRGHQILLALDASSYPGEIYAVNPRGGQILGRDAVPSVDDLPEGVDLAVLCTPAGSAPDLIRACGRRGVGGAVVLAVGFGESGAAGAALEADLAQAAEESGVRVIGPNTSGLLNLGTGLNLVGARGVRPGGIAILVQSGNVALALMTEATERSWEGVSVCLGVGNQLDVGFAEALDYLEEHDATRAIVLYLEGVKGAPALLQSATRVGRSKPIVAIKSGRTKPGAAAARSHTGSMAGPYDRFSAALAQAGVVEVVRTDELLHVAETLGNQPACAPGKGIALLSDGGGQGTLAADALVEAGADLARLSSSTIAALRGLLGPAAAATNPVDLAGSADADPEVFARALETLLGDEAVGVVLVVGLFGGYGVRFSNALTAAERRAAEAMAAAASAKGVGLIVHSMYAAHRTEPLEALGERRVPIVASLDVACRCAVELQRRGTRGAVPPWGSEATESEHRVDPAGGRIVETVVAERRSCLTEPEARTLLGQYGLSFPTHRVATTVDEAVEAAAALGGPVALKLISATIVHKSDAGGVRLDLHDEDAVARAFSEIAVSSERWLEREGRPGEPFRVMVSRMVRPPRLEMIVGGYRDPDLGPVLALGAGGIWVEALGDVVHRLLPVTDTEILSALGQLRISRLLHAGRGRRTADAVPIVGVARAVARVLERHPEVHEVELNPVFVYETKVVPVDARVILGPTISI